VRVDRLRPLAAPTFLLTLVLGLPGCARPTEEPAASELPPEVRSATVTGVYPEVTTLVDGRWEGDAFVPGGASRPTLTLEPTPFAILGDGGTAPQAVLVVLEASQGGSGTFTYLALLEREPEGYRSADVQLLGDRVWVQRLDVRGDRVEATVEDAGPDEGLCCGTRRSKRRWLLDDDRLLPVNDLMGMVVFGHESRQLTPCDGTSTLWLADAAGGDLQGTYEALRAVPYEPVFMVLRGVERPTPAAEFAAGYAAELEVLQVRYAEREGFGCNLDLGEARFRAIGVEPFWRLDVARDHLLLSRPGVEVQRFESDPAPTDALSFRGVNRDRDEVVVARLSQEPCVDPMSGARYAYRADVSVGAEQLAGCALAAPGE